MVALARGVDMEGRGLLLVKGAARLPCCARPPYLYIATKQIDDIDGLLNSSFAFCCNSRHVEGGWQYSNAFFTEVQYWCVKARFNPHFKWN